MIENSELNSEVSIATLESKVKNHVIDPYEFKNNPITQKFINDLEEDENDDELTPEELEG